MIWFDDMGLIFASFRGKVAKTTFSSYAAAKRWLDRCKHVGDYVEVV